MKKSITILGLGRRRYQTRRVLLIMIVGVSLSFIGGATLNKGRENGCD